jgi:hypothetical protein
LVITANLDKQQILSLTHFPAPINMINNSTNLEDKNLKDVPNILFRIQGIADIPGFIFIYFFNSRGEEEEIFSFTERKAGNSDGKHFAGRVLAGMVDIY